MMRVSRHVVKGTLGLARGVVVQLVAYAHEECESRAES